MKYPKRTKVVHGSSFEATVRLLVAKVKVIVEDNVINKHSNLGFGERYCQLLRKNYIKLSIFYGDKDQDADLMRAVKTMSDAINPEGSHILSLVRVPIPQAVAPPKKLHERPALKDHPKPAQTTQYVM